MVLSTASSWALTDITGEEIVYCEWPVIIAGDFNVKFSWPEAESLLTFLKNQIWIGTKEGRNDPPTKGETDIEKNLISMAWRILTEQWGKAHDLTIFFEENSIYKTNVEVYYILLYKILKIPFTSKILHYFQIKI